MWTELCLFHDKNRGCNICIPIVISEETRQDCSGSSEKETEGQPLNTGSCGEMWSLKRRPGTWQAKGMVQAGTRRPTWSRSREPRFDQRVENWEGKRQQRNMWLKILVETRLTELWLFRLSLTCFGTEKACDQKLSLFPQGKPALLVSCVSFQIYSINRNANLEAMCLVDSSVKRLEVGTQISEMSILGPQGKPRMERRKAKLGLNLAVLGWQMITLGVGGGVSCGGRGRVDWQPRRWLVSVTGTAGGRSGLERM